MQVKTIIFLILFSMALAGVASEKRKKGCNVNGKIYKKNQMVYKDKKKCLKIKCKREKVNNKKKYVVRTSPFKRCECNTVPCPDTCTLEHNPVCASDGIIYSNLCLLKAEACRTPGLKEAGNPKSCQICPGNCPTKYVPVCGSDGVLYDNACRLQEAACQTAGLKEAKHQSTCKPCPDFCSTEYNPVCASNGVTFSNPCKLQRYTCKVDSSVTLALNPATCDDLCPTCPTLADPVCGSDGVTYINECSLKSVAKPCGSKDIEIDYRRPCHKDCYSVTCSSEYKPICGSNGVLHDNLCTFYQAVCLDRDLHEAEDQSTTCPIMCPTCRSLFAPVCGSNGITYNSDCELMSVARPCGDLPISLASVGPCPSDCESDVCSAEYNPICGTDGVIYDNRCKLQVAACSNPSLTQAEDFISCPFACPLCIPIYAPVCGTNGITYNSECELISVARPCGSINVQVASVGLCASDCTTTICTADFNPICGSDGNTYSNLCALKVEICSNPSLTQSNNPTVCTAGRKHRRKREGEATPSKVKQQRRPENDDEEKEKEKKKKPIPATQNSNGGRRRSQSETHPTARPRQFVNTRKDNNAKTTPRPVRPKPRASRRKCTYNGHSYWVGQLIKNLHSYCLVIKCGINKNKPILVFDDLPVTSGQICECKKEKKHRK